MAALALAVLGLAAAELHVHNPHAVPVTKIHVVLSSHFDGGCKTPNCAPEYLTPDEPDRCATVGMHWPIDPKDVGEPWAYHIVNRCASPQSYPFTLVARNSELTAPGPCCLLSVVRL